MMRQNGDGVRRGRDSVVFQQRCKKYCRIEHSTFFSDTLRTGYLFNVGPRQEQRGLHEEEALLQREQRAFVYSVVALHETDQENSPHTWPSMGGGKSTTKKLTESDLFKAV